jgi:hypothetical protein
MKVSPTKEVPRGKQDVLSGKPQRLWDYFKKLIRYLTDSYEDLANTINYNDDRRRENRNDIDTLQNDSLFVDDLAVNGGSIPEVDRQNDFSSMPLVNGDAIVESGNNSNGSYVRWADGTQVCHIHRLTLPYDQTDQCLTTWTFPASFVDSAITCNPSIIGPNDSTSPNAAATNATPSTTQLSAVLQGGITSTSIDIAVQRLKGQVDFASGDEMYVTITARGSWK